MSDEKRDQTESRRVLLKKAGRFAVVTAPAVTLLLATSTKPAKAQVVSDK
jgi:hypothetical protein